MSVAEEIGGASVCDFPLKWSHLKQGLWNRKTNKGFCPVVEVLEQQGIPVDAVAPGCTHSVFLAAPLQHNIQHLRDWLAENAENQHTIFGRFRWTRYNLSCVRECDGVRFYFKDQNTAMYFMLAFG